MKVLLDSCVSADIQQILEDVGHDVFWAGSLSPDPGDAVLLARAHNEGRVLVTMDKDFGGLVIVYGRPHSGIVRLTNMSTEQQGRVCLTVLRLYDTDLASGAIITASINRVRIRRALQHEELDD
jgi:predicted nuclease of predicted toxin-antitoxin system